MKTGERVRERQQRERALNRPRSRPELVPDPPRYVPPPLIERPPIISHHPAWWQVYRIELDPALDPPRRAVLIAEVRTEDEAFKIATSERWQVRITKWGHRAPPFYSHRDPKPPG